MPADDANSADCLVMPIGLPVSIYLSLISLSVSLPLSGSTPHHLPLVYFCFYVSFSQICCSYFLCVLSPSLPPSLPVSLPARPLQARRATGECSVPCPIRGLDWFSNMAAASPLRGGARRRLSDSQLWADNSQARLITTTLKGTGAGARGLPDTPPNPPAP